jgi:hypothetical protein
MYGRGGSMYLYSPGAGQGAVKAQSKISSVTYIEVNRVVA